MRLILLSLLFSFSVHAQFSTELQGNITVSFNGVNCGSCSDKVEKSFKDIKGVQSVSVDVENKKIYIALEDTKSLSEEFIKSEITKYGYIFISAKGGYSE